MTVPPTSGDPGAARDRDRRHVWHGWAPLAADRSALMISHGDGYRVWDVDGNEYVDGMSLNASCGHRRTEIVDAVTSQALRLQGVDQALAAHEQAGLLAERLSSHLPGGLTKTLFVNSGSEGIEAAVTIATGYWSHVGEPRSRLVAFTRGYHGSTVVSRGLSGIPHVGHPFAAPFPVTHVDLPREPRDMYRPEALAPALAAFERAIADGPPPVAVVMEPFLNVGGGIALPDGFLRGLRALCDEAGTLLVLDEVFTAYGRAGRMFACLREDVAPDVVVSSKGLSGGYVPIAAVTVRQDVHDSFADEPLMGGLRYGHTTSGHAVACAAALATLDVIEKDDLPERAERLGGRLLDRLRALAGTGDVTDVRGLGLILVVELSSPEAAARVKDRAQSLGLLLRLHGDAVMAAPPLVMDDEGIDAIADRLERAVAGAG